MPKFADCYCLIPSRAEKEIFEFLDYFMKERQYASDEFYIEDESFTKEFEIAHEFFLFLEEHPTVSSGIYWSNNNFKSLYCHAMVFYTNDEQMIFGISTPAEHPNATNAIQVYKELKEFTNAKFGCITIEEVAPYNAVEFREFCKNRYVPD